jgi:hypothetical protein
LGTRMIAETLFTGWFAGRSPLYTIELPHFQLLGMHVTVDAQLADDDVDGCESRMRWMSLPSCRRPVR